MRLADPCALPRPGPIGDAVGRMLVTMLKSRSRYTEACNRSGKDGELIARGVVDPYGQAEGSGIALRSRASLARPNTSGQRPPSVEVEHAEDGECSDNYSGVIDQLYSPGCAEPVTNQVSEVTQA